MFQVVDMLYSWDRTCTSVSTHTSEVFKSIQKPIQAMVSTWHAPAAWPRRMFHLQGVEGLKAYLQEASQEASKVVRLSEGKVWMGSMVTTAVTGGLAYACLAGVVMAPWSWNVLLGTSVLCSAGRAAYHGYRYRTREDLPEKKAELGAVVESHLALACVTPLSVAWKLGMAVTPELWAASLLGAVGVQVGHMGSQLWAGVQKSRTQRALEKDDVLREIETLWQESCVGGYAKLKENLEDLTTNLQNIDKHLNDTSKNSVSMNKAGISRRRILKLSNDLGMHNDRISKLQKQENENLKNLCNKVGTLCPGNRELTSRVEDIQRTLDVKYECLNAYLAYSRIHLDILSKLCAQVENSKHEEENNHLRLQLAEAQRKLKKAEQKLQEQERDIFFHVDCEWDPLDVTDKPKEQIKDLETERVEKSEELSSKEKEFKQISKELPVSQLLDFYLDNVAVIINRLEVNILQANPPIFFQDGRSFHGLQTSLIKLIKDLENNLLQEDIIKVLLDQFSLEQQDQRQTFLELLTGIFKDCDEVKIMCENSCLDLDNTKKPCESLQTLLRRLFKLLVLQWAHYSDDPSNIQQAIVDIAAYRLKLKSRFSTASPFPPVGKQRTFLEPMTGYQKHLPATAGK